MSSTTKSGETPDYPLDVSMEAFSDMAKILNALGNEDSLAIFLYAKDGISSSKDAIRTLGLTQKRFYTRLKDLIDYKLMEKVEGGYHHTALGEIMCDIGLSMEKLLLNKEQLSLLGSIKKSGKISSEKKTQIAKTLSIELPFLNLNEHFSVITSFDEVVKKTINYLDEAEEEVNFVSLYFDIRVVEKILNLLESGIDMYFISNKDYSLKDISKMVLSMMFNQRMVKSFYDIMKSPDIKYKTLENVPYTFFIVDQKYSMVEIAKPFSKDFFMAFFFEDEFLSKKLREAFDALWNSAEPMNNFFNQKG